MRKQFQIKQKNTLQNIPNSSIFEGLWILHLNCLESGWLLTVQDQSTRQTIVHRTAFT